MAVQMQSAKGWLLYEQYPSLRALCEDIRTIQAFLQARQLTGRFLPFIPQKGSRDSFMREKAPSQDWILRNMFDLHLLLVALLTQRNATLESAVTLTFIRNE
jgi:hypothetical protein